MISRTYGSHALLCAVQLDSSYCALTRRFAVRELTSDYPDLLSGKSLSTDAGNA